MNLKWLSFKYIPKSEQNRKLVDIKEFEEN